MKKPFETGNYYYIKITIPPNTTEIDDFEIGFPTGIKWRINGGSWNTCVGTSDFSLYSGTWELNVDVPQYPTTGDVVEIYALLDAIDLADGLDYLLPYTLENPYVLDVYQLTCERNQVDKSTLGSLSLLDTIYGILRDGIDVVNPSIIITYGTLPTFNYIYIPSLNRYYFVENVVAVRNNVYQLDLHVDVLYSFKTDILLQSGFISRNENTSDGSIVDERRPVTSVYSATLYDVMVKYPTTNEKTNVTFNQNLASSAYRFVLTTFNNVSTLTTHEVNNPAGLSRLDTISSMRVRDICYVFPYKQVDTTHWGIEDILFCLGKDDSVASFVESVVAYPFDVVTLADHTDFTTFIVGSKKYDKTTSEWKDWNASGTTPVDAYELQDGALQYLVIADFTPTSIYSGSKSYLDYEPYSNYELYIPFVGWIKVNAIDILNKRILVYYGVDISTGFATAYVYNYSEDRVIYSTSCQIGIKIPINTTNAMELEKQKQSNTLNMVMGLVSGGISAGIGLVSQNPVALVGGALSIGKTIASNVNANRMLIERANTSFISAGSVNYSHINKVLIRNTYHAPLGITESEYAKLNGYPVNQYGSLNTFTGYTEIPILHYVPSSQKYIINKEIDEIESLVKDGVIL